MSYAQHEKRSLIKIVNNANEALAGVKSGSHIMVGGFGLSGIPEFLLHHVSQRDDIKDLIIISTESGINEVGVGMLMHKHQVKRQLCSFIGRCKIMEEQYLKGELELEMMPQGTLAERIRAAAFGTPGFYTRAGANTWLESGKIPMKFDKNGKTIMTCPKRKTAEFDGKKYLWEPALHSDFAFIRAKVADKYGNCRFATTARNFNVVMAQAAKITIVEAEKIVEPGQLHPDDIHLPGVYVDRVVQGSNYSGKIEVLKYREQDSSDDTKDSKKDKKKDPRYLIASRAAKECAEGLNINLGVGIPSDVPQYTNAKMLIQSENGILGVGPLPRKGEENPDLIDAGKQAITYVPGASSFDSSTSFGMIRAGKIALTMLGAMEVAANGDIANWMIPGKKVSGMGGAMDLVANPDKTKVVALMQHTTKHGEPKIKEKCDLPLTGAACVSMIITELAVFTCDPKKGLTLIELQPGAELEDVKKKTGCKFEIADSVQKQKSKL